jgi:hypothetical protein
MNKIVPAIFSLLTLCGVSFGQIQISGGGTGNLVFTVLQDISFQIDSGEAWGYVWGVKLNNSLTSADGYAIETTPVSGTGPGGVLLGGTAPYGYNFASRSNGTVNPEIINSRIGSVVRASSLGLNNGVYLGFEYDVDFKLSVGSTFTLRQGSYEREWAGTNGANVPQNTLVSPGTTYTITKDNFFSSSEQGSRLDTSKISLVPEPSALSLLAVGLGGWAMMRRRRS